MLLGGIAVVSALVSLGCCLGSGGFDGFSWLYMLPAVFAGSFLILLAVVFGIICLLVCRIDAHAPESEDDPRYRRLAYLMIEAIMTLLQTRVHTAGLEKTPRDTRFLLVCNHQSLLDPLLLFHFFEKSHLAFVSKRENADMFLVGKLMHKLLTQTINRENDREALKTILNCIKIIKEDRASVAVFPEGYTSKDSLLHHLRPGVFKIAQKASVPVVVCTMQNTRKIFGNARHLRPTHVQLHLVGVIPAEELKGVTAVDISERVHQMMADDLGPDLVAAES